MRCRVRGSTTTHSPAHHRRRCGVQADKTTKRGGEHEAKSARRRPGPQNGATHRDGRPLRSLPAAPTFTRMSHQSASRRGGWHTSATCMRSRTWARRSRATAGPWSSPRGPRSSARTSRDLGVPTVLIERMLRPSTSAGWAPSSRSTPRPRASALTRARTGWTPERPGLIEDLEAGHYFQNRPATPAEHHR